MYISFFCLFYCFVEYESNQILDKNRLMLLIFPIFFIVNIYQPIFGEVIGVQTYPRLSYSLEE